MKTALTLCALLLAAEAHATDGVVALPPAPTADNVVVWSTASCKRIDFEILSGCNTPAGIYTFYPETLTVDFGCGWQVTRDADEDTSCGGNIANEPSPPTVAYFRAACAVPIGVSKPLASFSLWYSAALVGLPVTVTAYDDCGTIVDQQIGNTIGTWPDGAPCSGDPNGHYCGWSQLTLSGASPIRHIAISSGSTGAYVAYDDMEFCLASTTSVPEPTSTARPPHDGYYDLAGRRISGPPNHGLYWRVTNGKPRKLLSRRLE